MKISLVKCLAFLACISFCILNIVWLSAFDGVDYTEEYKLYLQVKSYKDYDAIRSKLQSMGVEYRISKGSLSLTEYNNISFTKTAEGWIIDNNNVMMGFEQLDLADPEQVTIFGTKSQNGDIVETIKLEDNYYHFIKVNNHYSYYNDTLSVFFPLVASITFASLSLFLACDIIFEIVFSIKKRKRCSTKNNP